MSDKQFKTALVAITVLGMLVTVVLLTAGFMMWQKISIVELIANWK